MLTAARRTSCYLLRHQQQYSRATTAAASSSFSSFSFSSSSSLDIFQQRQAPVHFLNCCQLLHTTATTYHGDGLPPTLEGQVCPSCGGPLSLDKTGFLMSDAGNEQRYRLHCQKCMKMFIIGKSPIIFEFDILKLLNIYFNR